MSHPDPQGYNWLDGTLLCTQFLEVKKNDVLGGFYAFFMGFLWCSSVFSMCFH